jgi:hypothetical protein
VQGFGHLQVEKGEESRHLLCGPIAKIFEANGMRPIRKGRFHIQNQVFL